MNRPCSWLKYSLVGLLSTGLVSFSSAATDYNGDGMCDVWQQIYNAWTLDPGADDDHDGCTNLTESIAGTDPRNPADSIRIGNVYIAGSNVVLNVMTERGKSYQLQSSSDPGGPSWADEGAAVVGNDTNRQFVTPVGSGLPRKFYRVETQDQDSDNDGVSDWAEAQTGTNPLLATSASNASGGVASDGDTMRSLLSLTAIATEMAIERVDRTIASPVSAPAKITLSRSFGTMPLNQIPMNCVGAPPTAAKGSASAADLILGTVSFPSGAASVVATIAPVKDNNDEVPEYAKIQFGFPGLPTSAGASATITISDSDPAIQDNRQLYVAFLGREGGVTSTASGYATALVAGDNNSASISVVFSNLSSPQNTAYIRIGSSNSDLEVTALPLGQVAGSNWNIRAAQYATTDQAMLNALAGGQVYVTISSANYPEKEIFGYFNKASGSPVFNPANPDLVAPTLGSANWMNPTGEALERDIWRFLSQSTFGGTTALYNQVMADVTTSINGGGTYIDGLGVWLDKQMNSTLTPSINFQTLVMAADNEEFMLRGNKPITWSSDPQINGAVYPVTYDAATGSPMVGNTADTNRISNNYPQSGPNRRREWWSMVLQCKDQVRQRMALALSEILVISEADQTILDRHYGCANYWDMLATGAFGRYRNLLEQVTYNPMMGIYLSHMANRAVYDANYGTPPVVLVTPDENYAREIMQLFSIGLVLRHPDGSLVLNNDGLPIATYDQNDITELARVMTGFSHGARHTIANVPQWNGTNLVFTASNQRVGQALQMNGSDYNTFGRDDGHLFWAAPWTTPMKVLGRVNLGGAAGIQVVHDFNAYVDPATGLPLPSPATNPSKRLLAGKHGQYDIPVRTGLSNDAAYHNAAALDLTEAHNSLAGNPNATTYGQGTQASPGHQNTPVNLSRWLIQRLITSNPSNGYIYRVSEVYRSTNGNLGQVMKAILLDYEARSLQLADTSIAHGKVKEPLVAFAAMLRGLRAFSGAPISLLKDTNPSFSETDSPMPGPYSATEFVKFDTANAQPPSLPAGWASGPFRYRFNDLTGNLGQSPQKAPSVFNWFLPDYVVPGPMANAGLFAPELQISTESSEVAKINYFYAYTWANLVGQAVQPGSDNNVSDFVINNGFATPSARFQVDGVFTNTVSFNSSNWNTDRTITITGIDNTRLSGLLAGDLRFVVSGTSNAYSGIAVPPVAMTVSDNEVGNEGLVVAETSYSTWVQEGGNQDTFTVMLSAPPMAGVSVQVNMTPSNAQISLSSNSLSFTSANWNVPQTVTITATNDAVSEAAGTANSSISFATVSAASSYNGLTTTPLNVNVVDNDDGASSLAVVITEVGGTTDVTEGSGTDTFQIRLTRAPTGNVTVAATASGLYFDASGTATTKNIVFTVAGGATPWNVAQTITVRANDDSTIESNHTGTITFSVAAAGGYSALNNTQIQPITASITDNERGITLAHVGGGETRVSEDGSLTDTISVRLRTAPTSNVTVNLGSSQVICSPAFLTFTNANYATPQNITVRGTDDSFSEGLHTTTITAYSTSADGNYNGLGGDTAPYRLTATVIDNDGGRILLAETGGRTEVSEQGVTDTYTLALNQPPKSDVTINIIPTAQVSVTPTSLTFTSANWNTAQTVTVSAVNDNAAEGDMMTNITHNVLSSDASFGGLTLPALAVSVIDNDRLPLTITHLDGFTAVAEGGPALPASLTNGVLYSSDTFRIALPKAPTGPVTVTLIPDGQITVSPSVLTFSTSANVTGGYNQNQTVTVTVVNDELAEATPHQGVIRFQTTSTDIYYNGCATAPMIVPIRDNDGVGFSIVETGVNTSITLPYGGVTFPTETGTDSYMVSLTKAPTSNVIIDVASANTTTGVTVSPAFLTFTSANWSTAQTVTVTAVGDNMIEGRKATDITNSVRAGSDSNFTSLPSQTVTAWVYDNPRTNESLITVASGNTHYVAEGDKTDTVSFYLSTKPKRDVTVSVDSSTQLSYSANAVTFTPDNWNVPQTIMVTAIDDNPAISTTSVEGNHTTTMQFRCNAPNGLVMDGDPSFTFVNPGVTFNIVDNEAPGVIFDETDGSTNTVEGGATDTYSVKLSKAPNGNVAISCTSANTTAGQTVSPTSLTFNATNWSTPQAVTVTATNDTTNEANHSYNITHAINTGSTSDTSGYASLSGLQTITNYITDNDNRIIVLPTGLETRVGESGAFSDTYQVVLRSAPASNVTVNLSVPANQGFAASPTSLVFNSGNWSTPQNITVTGVNNNSNDRIHTTNITHASVSSDTNFNSQTIAAMPVIVTTIDQRQAILYENGNTTVLSEGGITDTYFMALTHPPTANVTVTIQPDSQVEILGPTTLTFTPSNWSLLQTVTMRAVDDLVPEATPHTPHVGYINHTIASSDASYNGIPVAVVPCFITDNDLPHVDIMQTAGSTVVVEGGATDTYQLVLTSQPSANVIVTATANAQLTLSPSNTVTFTPLNWQTPQSLTVAAINDSAIEGPHTGNVTHSVSSTDPNYHQSNIPALTVSITDNDGARLIVGQTGGTTAVGEGVSDTITIRLSESIPAGATVDVTLVAPTYVIPVPPAVRQLGYYTSDLSASNQQRDRIVLDYTEVNLLYRSTFYGSLAVAYGGSNNIPIMPGETELKNAHWAASKAIIDKMDLWWCGGSLKARHPTLIEPNQPLPDPSPGPNPRQVILDAIYQINGGNNSLGTTRYLPEIVFDPKNPPNGVTFHDEIRDRCRWAAYLMTTVAPGLISH